MQIVKEVGGHVSKQSYPLRGEAGWSGHSGRASKIRREQWNETSPGEQTPGHLNGGILEKRFLEVDPRGPSNFDRKVCIGPTTSFCSLLRYEPLSFLSLSSPYPPLFRPPPPSFFLSFKDIARAVTFLSFFASLIRRRLALTSSCVKSDRKVLRLEEFERLYRSYYCWKIGK